MKNTVKRYLLKKSKLLRALVWLSDNAYYEHNPQDFREIGEDCIIHPICSISHKEKLIIKNNVQIHGNTFLHCQGGLHIGNNVGIGIGCIIVTADHIFKDSIAVPYGPSMLVKPVYINDNVWIGANVCILPGVEIGEGAIVGMGSVVTNDVRPCTIVMGNPAKLIGYRNKQEYERCKSQSKFVKHGYWDKMLVPKYTQIRPKLYNLIKKYVNNNDMINEE